MITEQGFIIPTIDEIYQRKLTDFKTVKPDLRETDSNIIIAWLRYDSAEEYDSYLQALSAFNQLSVYTATGSNLNAITSHLGITWNKAKKAIGKITIRANIGTAIPQAWSVETKSGIKFVTLNTETIIMNTNEIEIDVIALNAGTDGNISAGEITEQTEILNGVTSVTNKNNTLGGTDFETDTQLRERYLERLRRKTSFSTEGIKNYILENTNVKKCQVIENDTDLKDNDNRPPHSYETICLGDTDENIFKALYDYKLAGIRTVGDITKTFDNISVGFSRPIKKNIFFNIQIKALKNIWKEEYKSEIIKIFKSYIDEIEPEGTIYLYKIIGQIYIKTGGIINISIKIGENENDVQEKDFKLNRKEIAVLLESNINIGVVIV